MLKQLLIPIFIISSHSSSYTLILSFIASVFASNSSLAASSSPRISSVLPSGSKLDDCELGSQLTSGSSVPSFSCSLM
jgi:hypothetical protein